MAFSYTARFFDFVVLFLFGSALFRADNRKEPVRARKLLPEGEFEILSNPQIKPNSLQCSPVDISAPSRPAGKTNVVYFIWPKTAWPIALRAGNRILVQTTMTPYSRAAGLWNLFEQYL